MIGEAGKLKSVEYDEALSTQFVDLIEKNQLTQEAVQRLFAEQESVNVIIRFREFKGIVFDNLTLPAMKLCNVTFEGCSFVETHWAADFEATRFIDGQAMSKANFSNSTFTRCSFSTSDMCSCDFSDTQFINSTLEDCIAIGSIFVNSKNRNLVIQGGSLDKADMDGASGLILDDVSVRDVNFPIRSNDPWSVLRRKYTGAAMTFHLLAVVVFFGSLAAKVMMWQIVNRTQSMWAEALTKTTERCFHLADEQPLLMGWCEHLSIQLEGLDPSSSQRFEQWATWQVLLALDKGWVWFVFAVAILIYNTARMYLTQKVSLLREEEERTHRIPRRAVYGHLSFLHLYVVRVLFAIAILSFLVNLAFMLLTPVFLPKLPIV